MGRLMPLIGERLASGSAVADRILSWPGDPSSRGDSVPLRLAGALHALKLEGLALDEVYPPLKADDDTLWRAIEYALDRHSGRILSWLESPPQTNEVRRAAAILPALVEMQARFAMPVELLELGASAGLNLCADQFRLDVPGGRIGPEDSPVRLSPEWRGPVPVGALPRILARRGVDLNPIRANTPAGRLRLLSYLWPDQADRAAGTEAAIKIASELKPEVASGDAGTWAEAALASPAPDRVRVLFHTVAWQYFPIETQKRALAAMAAVTTPLVRVSMEADGGRGAELTITEFPGGKMRTLGRVDFHGRWVNLNA